VRACMLRTEDVGESLVTAAFVAAKTRATLTLMPNLGTELPPSATSREPARPANAACDASVD
jgi:hypothetical protein